MADERSNASKPVASRPEMPGYGLPEGDAGLIPWGWAEQRLVGSHNYWLATVRPDGRPHLMPIWGLWYEGAFYFSTGGRSRKTRNLESNAHCVVATDQSHEAVVVEGVAEKITDIELLKVLLRIYADKYDGDMATMEKDVLALREPIFAVRARVAFGFDEAVGMANATRWRFAAR